MNSPWTHEELAEMRKQLSEKIAATESQDPEIRPLPPLAESECLEHLFLMAALLPVEQSFIFGQLLAQYRQSIEARMLGRRGRYFVMSEADILRMGGKLG